MSKPIKQQKQEQNKQIINTEEYDRKLGLLEEPIKEFILPLPAPAKIPGHGGKNILSNTTPATPDEQKEHVSKSTSTLKKGRITEIENEMKRQNSVIQELNTNITKMMFIIIILSICLSAYKISIMVNVENSRGTGNIIELSLALLLSYFGINSTYKYTKQHPESGEVGEQIFDASKNLIEGITQFLFVKKKK